MNGSAGSGGGPLARTPDPVLAARERELEARYRVLCGSNLNLDLTRGKPSAEQLALSDALDGILAGDYAASDGTDTRNYGGLRGIPEARALGAEILGLHPDQVIAAGNSSLTLMYLAVDTALHHGLNGAAWGGGGAARGRGGETARALCPVPGYDRHFTLTEALGMDMTAVPMTEQGPDMDRVEALVASDPVVKCLWCVPKYSNPSGCIYSPDTVRRIARLPARASEGFIVLWDNAYAVHDFDFPPPPLENLLECAREAGTEDGMVLFGSTSKISFAGAGVGFVAGSPATLDRLEQRMSVMTVGHDKVNQLRHARFLGGRVREQMQAHAARVRPKFEAIERILSGSLGGLEVATWTRPRGGYFVTVDTLPNLASEVVSLAGDAGVRLTPAGATHPGGHDPEDRTIRLAPTFAADDDVAAATEILALCIELASVRALRRGS